MGTKTPEQSWEKLFKFMDENEFTYEDFLACVCANLLQYSDKEFNGVVGVGGYVFNVNIKKEVFTVH